MPAQQFINKPAPLPPPPPTELAEAVEPSKKQKDKRNKKREGNPLTINRNSPVSTPKGGAGVNVSTY
jgi:hypothetical protein